MATTTVVSKLAIQAIILGSAVYAAWVLVPVAFHAVVIPTVTALSALAGAFLFTPDAQKAKASLPLDAPRGLVNETGQDCAINSVRQLLRGDKEISEWFQSIPEEGANAETVEQFAARYGLGDGFVASYNGPGPAERGSPRAAFLKFAKGQMFANIFTLGDAYRRTSGGMGSEGIRTALHRINPRIEEGAVQIDAGDILRTIRDLLPDREKLLTETTRDREASGIPSIVPDRPEPLMVISLGDQVSGIDLAQRLAMKFFNTNIADGFRNERCQFLQAPRNLYLQLARSMGDVKNGAPLQVSSEIEIPLKDHPLLQRYRLMGFILHHGSTIKVGHYTAGRIVNGNRYMLNDDRVSLVPSEKWNEALSQAYILHYVPV